MIEEQACRDACNRAITDVCKAHTELNAWEIHYKLGHLPSEHTKGTCERFFDYRKAYITISPSTLYTQEQVYATMVHEMFHIVCAPFDLFLNFAEEKGVRSQCLQDASTEPIITALTSAFLRLHGNPFEEKEEVTPD